MRTSETELITTLPAFPLGYGGMPAKCAANLLTFGPVVAIHFECSERSDGWFIEARHRHYGTSVYECEYESYSQLTLGEACDVMDAVLWSLSEGNADSR